MTIQSADIGRAAFDVPADVAYFNVANLAPLLHTVRAAGTDAVARRGEPWQIAASDWFDQVERLRALAGEVFGGTADGVALVPATSYGMATAAVNLPIRPGTAIVVLDEEYPSGIYTWRRHAADHGATVVTVGRDSDQTWGEAIHAELDRLGDRAAIISVPQVHWTDGSWIDLETVVPRARELGAAVVLDLSQSLGVIPTDVVGLDVDFAMSVGYKWLLGPFGRTYLWVADRHRDGRPVEENWIVREGAEDFSALTDYTDRYQGGARRFDQGQRTAFETTPMAIAALEQILRWGITECSARIADLGRRLADLCRDHDLPSRPGPQAPHIIGVDLRDLDAHDTLEALRERACFVSVRAGTLRLAPHLQNTDEDFDRFAAGLASLR